MRARSLVTSVCRAGLLVLVGWRPAAALDVDWPAEVAHGRPVVATVRGTAAGFESDFLNASRTQTILGGDVEVGLADRAGVFGVSFRDDDDHHWDFVLVLAAAAGDRFTVTVFKPLAARTVDADAAGPLTRFWSHASAHLADTAWPAAKEYVPENAVGVTGSLVVCVGSGGWGCLIAGSPPLVDFAHAWLEAVATAELDQGELSRDEYDKVHFWLRGTNNLIQLAAPAAKGKAVAAVIRVARAGIMAVDAYNGSRDARVTATVFRQQLEKYVAVFEQLAN